MLDEKISAGSFDLNTWLYGGYEQGVITMIAGPPASGKTNFVLLAACSQAKKGNKVIFIDTEGGFSVERVKQIVGENYKDILQNIFLLNPTSFEKQKRILAEIYRKEQIPIIITNQVYHGFLSEEDWKKGIKPEVNIVGGDLLKYWSKCIIELKLVGNRRKAILLKHRSLGQKEMNFEVKDKGIFKKRWL